MKLLATVFLTLLFSSPLMAGNATNFNVALSGANERPTPNDSTTTGTAQLHVNQALTEITFRLDVTDGEDLLGAAGAHFHCGPADGTGPIVVWIAGSFLPGYDGAMELRGTVKDENIVNTACGATILELVESMLDGNVYVNVHSTEFPGGVIRGQIQ